MIIFDKGFYEFEFFFLENMKRILTVGS